MRMITRSAALFGLGLAFAACDPEDDGACADGGADTDADADTETDTDADTDSDSDETLAGELTLMESSMLGSQSSSLRGVVGEGGFRVGSSVEFFILHDLP